MLRLTRTRVKFCGLTRAQDVVAGVAAGADALGFVCYAKSPRYVDPARLAQLVRMVPPLVTPVLLFVNADVRTIAEALASAPNALLQFHGDETAAFCSSFARPFVRAVSMADGVDLLDCEREYESAVALMLDAPTAGYGGGGTRFDWARVPAAAKRRKPLVLAGGLTDENVGAAIAAVEPFAVDVSSGIEASPGIKSVDKMYRFVAAVRAADPVAAT